MSETNGNEWRARVEKQLDELQLDTKILLRAQVLHAAELSDHSGAIAGLTGSIKELREHGREIDARIDRLVSAIGEIVRRIPLPPE